MKFQWYIIDCEEGTVQGTNDVEKAEEYITDDRYILLTAQHGTYFCGSRKDNSVQELEDDSESDPEDEDLEG